MRWFPPAAACLIAWGALAFGAEYPWAYAPLLVFAATIGALGLTGASAAPSELRSLALPLALIFAAVGLQLCPMPATVLAALSPARLAHDFSALFATAVPSVPDVETAPAIGSGTISLSPARTLLAAAFLAALSLFFWGCCRALGAVRASAVARGVAGVGLLVALVAIVQEATDSPMVYGLWWPRKVESLPAAPLINENHLAGWLVMAVSLAAGHLAGRIEGGPFATETGWRRRVRWFASREGSGTLLVALSAFVMAVAITFTLSVSGIAALFVVWLVFSWFATRRARARGLVRATLIALPLAVVGWVGIGVVGEEFAVTSWSDIGGRVPIWRDTVKIVRDFPVTGTGLNTYGIAMLAYQTDRLDVHVVEAHNDYLQLAAEGGVLVGLPFLLLLAMFVRGVGARFREAAEDRRTTWLRVGAVAGLVALAVQSLVDFSLQMPGNAVLFVLLMAIAIHRPPPRPAREAS